MTAINSINSYSAQTTGTQPKKEMGKEQFLKILAVQLQNQDPTKPMEDRDMISQMAQLSVLEQLSNLNQSLSAFLFSNQKNDLSQYSNMLEKKVTWTNPKTNELETGVVSGVKYKDNLVYFQIGDQEIASNAIKSVELNK
ncbi:flagellar hook capping FlgD N-terminal domain-containing protein [Neobacillus sp. 114]|uniref:flagellar hook capping FlgD N-terminal domain-containing protein n=1 Tax=Neobacillus sp. 114 TaxID=3048535 RepID=UPI0024C2BA6B|nr:flagellar hook capping FlgD N-terminal domain-containing protein [Neobacillus sp. 114]